MKILITGLGIVSPIGLDLSGNLDALLNRRSGLSQLENLPIMRRPFIGGEIKLSDEELKEINGIDKSLNVQRTNLLGLQAAKEAWADRSCDPLIRTGVFFGTTIGGINVSDEVIKSHDDTIVGRFESLHDTTFGTDFIARHLGVKGYRATISTACSTAANAILLGARMIRAGLIDRALVGGAEAITNYTLNGFDSLQLYASEKNKPFDANREGLNLGEGGAFLVLESESSAVRMRSTVYAELIGWGNACDAFHQTASSPDGLGAEEALREALKCAGITSDQIDSINTHGTGTLNNDLSESNYLKRCFAEIPSFTSTKSYTGHTLAAAGGIEAVFSVLSLQNGLTFPTLNFEIPIEETGLVPVTEVIQDSSLSIILSSSYGFVGNCTQLIFRK
jgi:3-oxoacyl-(acyl-carrier-protein) synthase